MQRIVTVAGARPNFMKIAPIARQLARFADTVRHTIVHTGQHYDRAMSEVFFDQLCIPEPDINLNVGSSSHTVQTAAVMTAFEPVIDSLRPDTVVVVGDVNSTLACALVAAKRGVRLAHVEAGLRSFDRTMPEEINRVLTDQISDVLFTTERTAAVNLAREGIPEHRVHFVGNVMIDTLLTHRERARGLAVAQRYGLQPGAYGTLTLHRPSNVDDQSVFDSLLTAIADISRDVPIVFPVHPRTRPRVLASPLASTLVERGALRLLEPLGYLEFIGLMDSSAVVLTDSGGIQEETTILQVPCLTLRTTTERPITVSAGTNQVVGTQPADIVAGWRRIGSRTQGMVPELWDGRAAERIVDVLRQVSIAA